MAVKSRLAGFTFSVTVGAAVIVKVTGIDCGLLVAPDPVTAMVDV